MRDGGQLTLGICGESRALGQVLAQQAIGLLVGSTLPGAVRIDNAHLEREAVRHPLRLRQLFPPIIGQRFLQWGRDMPKRLREVLVRPRASVPSMRASKTWWVVRSSRVPTIKPFSATLRRSSSQCPGTARSAASVLPTRLGSTGPARLPQGRQPFSPQGTTWQHLQPRLDGFSRQPLAHVVRIPATQTSHNLLGRAARGQVCPDRRLQPWVTEFSRAPWVVSSDICVALRRTGPGGTVGCRVLSDLAAHWARGPSPNPRQGSG